VNDCLLAVDVFNDFAHEDGSRLLDSLRQRRDGFERVLRSVRTRGIPVVFANDTYGIWDGDSRALVNRALAGPGGDLVRPLAPQSGELFLVKPRYSAFDLTPLELVLSELRIERIVLMGMATEMCVTQTAIDARERDFKVTVVAEACATVDERIERIAVDYLVAVTGTVVAATLGDVD
jgi:nicotinamidase-related amidase